MEIVKSSSSIGGGDNGDDDNSGMVSMYIVNERESGISVARERFELFSFFFLHFAFLLPFSVFFFFSSSFFYQ